MRGIREDKMDHDQIVKKIRLTKKLKGLRTADIAAKSGQTIYKVQALLRGDSISLYSFMDITDAMDLELNLIDRRAMPDGY
jgi:transcriptional regulator with XRE-family HTH domain